MRIYNRSLGKYEFVSQYGGGLLEILYGSAGGRLLLKLIIHPVFSRWYGYYNRTALSRRRIAPFVEKYGIRMEDYEQREFSCFRDFFVRRPRPESRPVDMAEESFISPADSKLSVYPIGAHSRIPVKGVEYTLSELTGGMASPADYEGGMCMAFRLTMDDCHRYCFVDGGRVTGRLSIRGKLHTVSPVSREYKVYRENSRVVNVLKTRNFGRIVCIEVGALFVGRIVNHPVRRFEKGMEKGYFEPGGSTILLLLQKDRVTLDEDIARVCGEGTEVKIRLGERIGSKKVC